MSDAAMGTGSDELQKTLSQLAVVQVEATLAKK